MFGAIKQENGKYTIVECWPYVAKTWGIRNKLKELGGTWNPDKKCWENIKEEDLPQIKASKEVKIRIEKYCHEEERDITGFEHEIKDGRVGVSCPRCDTGRASGMTAKVLKIYNA